MKHNIDKTNVMRILDQKHIKYERTLCVFSSCK